MNPTAATKEPQSPWTIEPIVLRERTEEIPGVFTLEFEFVNTEHAQQYSARPGQFNMLYCPGYGEAAISLSRIDNNTGRLVHTIRKAGDVTSELDRLKAGDVIGCRGPFGNNWPELNSEVKHLILVGGGIGMAPLRPVIEHFLATKLSDCELSILIGARSCEGLLYQKIYETWRESGANVMATVDRSSPEWLGDVGVVPTLIDRLTIRDPQQTHLFACGPEVMMSYSVAAALGRQIPAENIWFSMERHMNCAIGHCGRCQFGTHFVCTGGPVFCYPDVKQLIKIHGL